MKDSTNSRRFTSMTITLCIFLQFAALSFGSSMTDDLEILDRLLQNYDRRATPSNHLDTATVVDCQLYIRSFGSIDPNSMDYQVDLYLRQTWVDERLNHRNITQPLDLNDPNLVKAIWKPEVYFPNAKHAEFQFVTVPNVLVRINPHGEILYMLRLKLLFSCMLELSKFPLDSQTCTMEVASFSKTMKELELRWKSEEPITMYDQLRMPQFEIDKIQPAKCRQPLSIGNYSCLVAEFQMHRSIGFHLVQSYLPTILMVAISWVSFWMDVDSVPGRTTLGVTTLLTVSTKSSGIQGGLPQVSYVKAIDVWMGSCTAFVFCALLEFTLVNYMWRKRPQPKIPGLFGMGGGGRVGARGETICTSCKEKKGNEGTGTESGGLFSPPNMTQMCNKTMTDEALAALPLQLVASLANSGKGRAHAIDANCRVIFPLSFCFFNVIYWCYYLLD